MAKKTEYTTDDDLTNAVSALLGNEGLPKLSALRENEVVILCCMKVRMDDDGETQPPKGNPVKLKKLSDLERLFVEGNAHYILTMDYHYWKNANQQQQMAKLYDELRLIKPEPSEKGLALKKWEPTVTVKFADTFEYFGAFDDDTLQVRNAMKNVSKRLKDFSVELPASAEEPEPEPESQAEPEAEAGEPAAEVGSEPEENSPEPEPAPKSKSKSGKK